MDIKVDEISKIIRQRIEGYEKQTDQSEVGTVISVGDGIARIYGLEKVMYLELLELPHGVMGMALNLEEDSVGAVLLGEGSSIKEGDQVRRTGRLMQVPAGDAMLGRVVDPLGNPIDGKGPVNTSTFMNIEKIAPGVVERQPVKEPLQTGLKAIDSMTPIGRGQRELIIGDRQTGKTAIGLDTIINQKGTRRHLHLRRDRAEAVDGRPGGEEPRGQRCAGVHHRRFRLGLIAGAAAVHRALRGMRDGRVLPCSTAPTESRPRPTTPGRAVLCVYDDLSKHAGRLPRDLAVAPPAAGPRGLSRRRVLSALAPARARLETERRQWRWIADRVTDHRDPGRRHLGLHPDQRDLDHRRPDLSSSRICSTPASARR